MHDGQSKEKLRSASRASGTRRRVAASQSPSACCEDCSHLRRAGARGRACLGRLPRASSGTTLSVTVARRARSHGPRNSRTARSHRELSSAAKRQALVAELKRGRGRSRVRRAARPRCRGSRARPPAHTTVATGLVVECTSFRRRGERKAEAEQAAEGGRLPNTE